MSWLLTKLRGLYRVMVDGAALPDVPAINFTSAAGATVGAAYNAAKNRIDITLPFGAITGDADTFVIRDGDGGVTAASLVVTGGATLGGGLGAFGASAPTVKPIITGSRGGNAAVANLLTTLATMGIVKDSTT